MNDVIYAWADGTWCVNGELHEMSHMSDDYITVPVGDDESYDAAAERHFDMEARLYVNAQLVEEV